MYFPDGDGVPQVAILTEPPNRFFFRKDEEADVNFLLYSVEYPAGEPIKIGNVTMLKNSQYNADFPTKFLVHGWMSAAESETIKHMRNAYLISGDYNIIVVDWEQLATNKFYYNSVWATEGVGKSLGKMISFLEENGSHRSNMHIVGHSLGAQVAGFAGSFVQPEKIARITGLDPARPGFEWLESSSGSLDASDAEFVDIIHTCGGALGYANPSGTADFYPNGGTPFQPGCCCLPEFSNACSHGRAHQFFAESIVSNKGFAAMPCRSWSDFKESQCEGTPILMGEPTPMNASGTYFLQTRAESPFAIGYLPWYNKAKKPKDIA